MRVEPRAMKHLPWILRPFLWNQRRKYGAVLDPALLWARSPKVFVAVALLYGMLGRRSSPLSPALRSLVTVRVSQINWCRFCVDINSATLLERGVPLATIQDLEHWRNSRRFEERERLALEYAETITRADQEVDDDLMVRLRRHFDDDAVIELTALIAFQNMSSKFNSALDVPAQGFCGVTVPPKPEALDNEPQVHGKGFVAN